MYWIRKARFAISETAIKRSQRLLQISLQGQSKIQDPQPSMFKTKINDR